MKIVIIAIILLLVCVVLMGIKVLFIKGASFPSGHVGSSPMLRAKCIRCASRPDYHSDKNSSKSH